MKRGYLASGILLAATTFFVPAANAQPVNLTCQDTNSQSVMEGRVTFDESEQTAGFIGLASGDIPADPATFTDTEIRWAHGSGNNRTHFSLNRSTETLIFGGYKWRCTITEKKY
jgi:hypothetical protein